MWTQKSIQALERALEGYDFPGVIRKKDFLAFLENEGYPTVAKKFAAYGSWHRRKAEIRPMLKSALAGNICQLCQEKFALAHVCPDCEHTPTGKQISRQCQQQAKLDTVVKRYGVQNVMQLKDVVARREQTLLSRYGTVGVFKVPRFRKKFENTMLERHGVRNASHSLELLHKAFANAYRIKKCVVEGVTFHYQGCEDKAIGLLADYFGVEKVLSQFDYEFERIRLDQQKDSYYTADLYLKSKKSYVEVKTVWTLLGDYRKGEGKGLKRNRLVQQSCNQQGKKLKYMVLEGDRFVLLPSDWWKWSFAKLKKFLAARLNFKFYP